MSRRAPAVLRGTVIFLCALGVLASAQRVFIALVDQARDDKGFTALERASLEYMTRITGATPGSPRYNDLESGTLAFEQKYVEHRTAILLHVIPGGLILLLAPFQFSDRIRRRYLAYHRWTGRVLVVSVAISGLSAFFFGLFMPFAGWRESVVIALFGALFFYSAARGYAAIRKRDISTHREWMTRMFAVAVGIATTRVASIALGFFTGLYIHDAFIWSLWIGFSSSVIVGELLIRRTRPHAVTTNAARDLLSVQ